MASKKDTPYAALLKGAEHYVQITSRVAIVTVAVIALLAVPAYYLDQYLGTWPTLFVVALLLSMPLSLYMVYRVIKDLTHNFKD